MKDKHVNTCGWGDHLNTTVKHLVPRGKLKMFTIEINLIPMHYRYREYHMNLHNSYLCSEQISSVVKIDNSGMSLFFTENSRASYFRTPAPYFDRKLWSYSLLLPISLQPSNKTKRLRNPLLVWGCDYPLIDFIIKFVSEEGLVNIRLTWSNMTDA